VKVYLVRIGDGWLVAVKSEKVMGGYTILATALSKEEAVQKAEELGAKEVVLMGEKE